MNVIKSFLYGPNPEDQKRKCNNLIRSNTRKLDRDIQQLKLLEAKTKGFIRTASNRAHKNSSQAQQAQQETRIFARELIRVRKQSGRLATSKAQLQSVQMQVNEAFGARKIEGSIKTSTGIMKDVNTLVKMPELTGTMRELSLELVRAGIIEEMVSDSLPDSELVDDGDDELETDVDRILGEVLKDNLPQRRGELTSVASPILLASEEEAEDEAEDQQDMLNQMRGRLEALKS